MRLLVSPKDETEARKAAKGGADIIDVKNPAEGSLGANFPWTIRHIRETLSPNTEISATLGDLPNLPGTASLAAYGLTMLGVDYVKAGLLGVKSQKEAEYMSKMIVRSVKSCNPKVKVVLAGYADWGDAGSISPSTLVKAASKAKAEFVMLDTRVKDGRTLLDYLDTGEIRRFATSAKAKGLKIGLAGSLDEDAICELASIKPDVVGVRGAVCVGGKRTSRISEAKVRNLSRLVARL